MKRGGSHETNDGRTIRIGNKRSFPAFQLNSLHSRRIHFRDHEWNSVNHPKRGAIIHNNGAFFNSYRPEFLAYTPPSAEKRNVNIVEAVLAQFLDCVTSVLICHGFSRGALGGQELEGAIGEVTVGEDGEEFLAHSAGDAYDRDGWAVFSEGHAD